MSLLSVFEKDGKKVLSIMELIAADAEKGLVIAVKYLPEAAALASLLFPAEAPAIMAGETAFVNVAGIIQSAVAEVEQKYALVKVADANKSGAQKSADVLALVSQVVIADLGKLKITANVAYVQQLINAVVAILNVPSVVAAA